MLRKSGGGNVRPIVEVKSTWPAGAWRGCRGQGEGDRVNDPVLTFAHFSMSSAQTVSSANTTKRNVIAGGRRSWCLVADAAYGVHLCLHGCG